MHVRVYGECRLDMDIYHLGEKQEEFELIVMMHKTDNVTTIAINEFPIMNDIVLESFTIDKIERKRKERTEKIRKLELEDLLLTESRDQIDNFSTSDIKDMLNMIQTPDLMKYLGNMSKSLQKKLQSIVLEEEIALEGASFVQLYEISINQNSSNYQSARATMLLNAAVNYLLKSRRSKSVN